MNKHKNNWGQFTWTLFHTLIELIPNDKYKTLGPIIFNTIKNMCTILPCPDCSAHATDYLKFITIKQLPTKEHLKRFMYQFHNNINIMNRKPIYPYNEMDKYKKGNLQIIFNNVQILFNKNYGNPRMMVNSTRRKKILQQVNTIIKTHY